MAQLTRTRHGVKSPDQFSRAHIIGTHVTTGPFRRELRQAPIDNHQVFVNGCGRSDPRPPGRCLRPFVRNSGTQINLATFAKISRGLTCIGIECKEPAVDRPEKYAPVSTGPFKGGAFPVANATMRIELALLLAGF